MEHPMKSPQIQAYLPLIVIVGYSILLGFFHKTSPMYGFMGFFLVFLSMFKFFDLKGFAQAYGSYDLVTQKFPIYGYIYPALELVLGLAYLLGFVPLLTNLVTLVVMGVGAAGVIKAILAKKELSCACLGTTLKVPLSTVSIIENLGMVAMAIFKIVMH